MNHEYFGTPEDKRRHQIAEVARQLGEFIPGNDRRGMAALAIVRMIEAWDEIQANWTAEDVGLGDTPEEVAKWQEAFLAAGEGIHRLAELIVEVQP